MYDGVEELAVPPAGGEVVAAQALVPLHHPLGPEQQLLLGGHVVRLAVHLNVGDLTEETVRIVRAGTPPRTDFTSNTVIFIKRSFQNTLFHLVVDFSTRFHMAGD